MRMAQVPGNGGYIEPPGRHPHGRAAQAAARRVFRCRWAYPLFALVGSLALAGGWAGIRWGAVPPLPSGDCVAVTVGWYESPRGIAIIPLQGGAPMLLPVAAPNPQRPAASRDGRWLAFESHSGRGIRVYVYPRGGGRVHEFYPAGGGARWPVWTGGQNTLTCVTRLSGLVATRAPRWQRGTAWKLPAQGAYGLAPSPDARLVAILGLATPEHPSPLGGSSVWVAALATGDLRALPNTSAAAPPSWSPHGRILAFPGGPDAFRTRILLVSCDGARSADLGPGYWCSWHPSLPLLAVETDGRIEVWEIHDFARKRLAASAPGTGPLNWAGGGRWLLFYRGDMLNGAAVCMLDIRANTTRILANLDATILWEPPVWLPAVGR